jgi:hypothetical protein
LNRVVNFDNNGSAVDCQPELECPQCALIVARCQANSVCQVATSNLRRHIDTALGGKFQQCDASCLANFAPPASAGAARELFFAVLACFGECTKSNQGGCQYGDACPDLAKQCNGDCSVQLQCSLANKCEESENPELCFEDCRVSLAGEAVFKALRACAARKCKLPSCASSVTLDVSGLEDVQFLCEFPLVQDNAAAQAALMAFPGINAVR